MFPNWNADNTDLTDFYGFYKNFIFKQNFPYYNDNHGNEQVYEQIRLKKQFINIQNFKLTNKIITDSKY
jgi:hypothetical protein